MAAKSLFDVFAHASEGMLLVDRSGCVVWINDQYRRYLPALGFASEQDFVGQPVGEVIQNTQMQRVLETGKPILIDLLTNKAGTFVVSRFPLRDDAGQVIGALGVVLFDQAQSNLQPFLAKFSLMQRELDEARDALAVQRRAGLGLRQARHSFASFIGASAPVVALKRQARRAAQSSSPVLLLGETGTGKELLAHAIHAASPRAKGPLVSVNIAAVPETLLEAEFFGDFTGFGFFVETDDNLQSAVLEIERVCMPLGTVADDRDLLPLNEAQVRIRIVVHRRHVSAVSRLE